mgnify:CR=1 FL=1
MFRNSARVIAQTFYVANVWFANTFCLASAAHGVLPLFLMGWHKFGEEGEEKIKMWFDEGNALVKDGKYEDAIKCYDKVLEIDPNYVKAWTNKSNALLELGRYEDAIVCSDNALKINLHDAFMPQSQFDRILVYNLVNKSKALLELGRDEDAIVCSDKALKIDPNYVDAWFWKAYVLGKNDKHEDAIKCWDELLEIDPNYVDAWLGKCVSLGKLGRDKEANACHAKALKIDPFNDMALKMAGR